MTGASDCTPEECKQRGPRGGRCARCQRRVDYLKNRDYYAAKGKRWREENPDRPRELWAAWYAEHRDEILANLASPEGRKRQKAWQDADRAANPERYRERERQWRQGNEAWTLRNRENSRRRQTGTTHSRVLYAAVLERDGMVCHICGHPIPSLSDLHFDHVIPLAKGGEHTLENVRPSHALCNLRKSDRLI